MPIYEYICEDCCKPFEKVVLKRAESIACPACGSQRHALQFSVVSKPSKADNGEAPFPSCGGNPADCGGCG